MDANDAQHLDRRPLGRTGLTVSRVGFGAVKIGRNAKLRYPQAFDLPDPKEVGRLLHGVLDAGINLIDTAAAYGQSEELIGRFLAERRSEYVLSTKAGEDFEAGRSTFDFTRAGLTRSVERSLRRLRTDAVDVLLLHSDGDDVRLLEQTDAAETLLRLRDQGKARAIGLSGKQAEGARLALQWSDVLMVTYHKEDRSHEEVMREAHGSGRGVMVKKGLASGHLPPDEAMAFLGAEASVDTAVIGTLSLAHLLDNARSMGAGV